MKTCKVCGETKPLEEFEKYKRTLDGHTSRCLVCGREYKKQKAIEKYGSVYAEKKRYRDSYKDELKQRKHEDYEARKEQVLAHNKKYYTEHKDEVLIKCKQYRETHSEWKKAYDKKYVEEHPDIILKIKRDYYNRNKDNTFFRIRMNLSGRIVGALRGRSKYKDTMSLVGCTLIELRKHLEEQFQEGMSWDNYGKDGWHVDHIRPCASFNLNSPEQQRECFHYDNLQPLWAVDNMQKGSLWQGTRRHHCR